MSSDIPWKGALERFALATGRGKSFLVLDLDGTALLEDHGKVFISSSVEKGIKAIYDLKIPVVLNTLRFPLSVISTIGEAWCQLSDVPILTVLLNGSLTGQIRPARSGLVYDEMTARCLTPEDLASVLQGVDQLVKAKIDDLLFFFYPRDWREGEILWVPRAEKIPEMSKKFVSASRVISGTLEALSKELSRREICMISLFVDRPEDTLMAYQHVKRNNFFTAKGVSKASGTRELASRLNLDPVNALGAGDTEMDTFLAEVGFAVIVGDGNLTFKGRRETVRVATPLKLGELILSYAAFLQANP